MQARCFWVRHARKFILKEDEANFEYVETKYGYPKILPHTINRRDAKGKAV